MNPTWDAFCRSWPSAGWFTAALVVSGLIYTRGWRALRRHDRGQWSVARLACFYGALLTAFAALASPVEVFASLWLWMHMVQHMLLLMVAAPLAWLAAPWLPMLRGLPRDVRIHWIGPLARSRWCRRLAARLTHPLVAGPIFVVSVWLWHAPRAYELALRNDNWHVAEHACFLLAAGLFWYPVVSPYPSGPRWPRLLIVPYLILADVQNTVLSAWLAFSAGPIYPHYATGPGVELTALEDQQLAGMLMWVPGSIAFLVPAFWIAIRALYGAEGKRIGRGSVRASGQSAGGTRSGPATLDLLQLPVVGGFLRWRHSRLVVQGGMAVLALAVVLDGLLGPQIAAENLAGVLPWIHWRGLLVLTLLVGGNFVCMACPFTLPRRLADRWLPAGRSWPRVLRNKWPAVALTALFLWSYEAFALWDSPWLTAWIAIGYFVAAFAVDAMFRGSAFCKYVCPIGQFNFVQSLVSPWEVRVKNQSACTTCQGHACLRGAVTTPGCGLHLFQPRKQGNLDCTFCLACVQACPSDNVGVLPVLPARDLADVESKRSGIGRFGRRGDIAALVVLLTFGALANAGGMVAPVVEWQDAISARLGLNSTFAATSAMYVAMLAVVPLILMTIVAAASRRGGGLSGSLWRVATRYAYCLAPLGGAVWLAHYSFHFFTSYGTIVPVTQRAGLDLGLPLGEPAWQRACCTSVPDWVVQFELVALGTGLLVSLLTAYRIAVNESASRPRAVWAFLPWGALVIVLFAAGAWVLLQPMQMRGTLTAGLG